MIKKKQAIYMVITFIVAFSLTFFVIRYFK